TSATKDDRPAEPIQQHQGAPHSAHEPPQGEPATEHIPQQAQPTQKVNRRSAYSEPRTQVVESPEPRQQTQRQPVQPAPQPAPYLQSPAARQQGFNDYQGQRHTGQPHYQGQPGQQRQPGTPSQHSTPGHNGHPEQTTYKRPPS